MLSLVSRWTIRSSSGPGSGPPRVTDVSIMWFGMGMGLLFWLKGGEGSK